MFGNEIPIKIGSDVENIIYKLLSNIASNQPCHLAYILENKTLKQPELFNLSATMSNSLLDIRSRQLPFSVKFKFINLEKSLSLDFDQTGTARDKLEMFLKEVQYKCAQLLDNKPMEVVPPPNLQQIKYNKFLLSRDLTADLEWEKILCEVFPQPSPGDRGLNMITGQTFAVRPHKIPPFELLKKYAKKIKGKLGDLSKTILVIRNHCLESTCALIEAFLIAGIPAENIFFTEKSYSTHEGTWEAIKKLKDTWKEIKKLDVTMHRGKPPKPHENHVDSGFEASRELLNIILEKKQFKSDEEFKIVVLDDGALFRQTIETDPRFDNVDKRHVEQTCGGIRRDKEREEKKPNEKGRFIVNVGGGDAKSLEAEPIACSFYNHCKKFLTLTKSEEITVIASEGRIGSLVVKMALKDGYKVLAYDKRIPDKPIQHTNLHYIFAKQNDDDCSQEEKIRDLMEQVNIKNYSFAENHQDAIITAITESNLTMACTGANIVENINMRQAPFKKKKVLLVGSNFGTFRGWFSNQYNSGSFTGVYDDNFNKIYNSSPVNFKFDDQIITIKSSAINFTGNHCIASKIIEITALQLFGATIEAMIAPKKIVEQNKKIVQLSPQFQLHTIGDWLQHNLATIKNNETSPDFIKMLYGGNVSLAVETLFEKYYNLQKIKENSDGRELPKAFEDMMVNLFELDKKPILKLKDIMVYVGDKKMPLSDIVDYTKQLEQLTLKDNFFKQKFQSQPLQNEGEPMLCSPSK